jgi:hypothetical protein
MPFLTFARVYASLIAYRSMDDKTRVPQNGIPARREANIRSELRADSPVNGESPVIMLADFLVYNFRGAVVCERSPNMHALIHTLCMGYRIGNYKHCGSELDTIVEIWGCAPFRLLDDAIATLELDLRVMDMNPSLRLLQNSVVEFTHKAGSKVSARELNSILNPDITDIWITLGTGSHVLHSELEEDFDADIAALEAKLAETKERRRVFQQMVAAHASLDKDVLALSAVDKMLRNKKRALGE